MKQMELKELINVRTGKLDANASSENGKYPFFTCSKETLKIDTYSYDCECVLLAGNGDLNVKYYNGKFNAYQRTYILECKNEIISTKYLYYFMKKYLKILRNQSIGGVIKYIKLANITEAIIPIYSKEEQEEIVNNLSKVEQILNIKNKQMEELQKFIKSQFVEMFGNIKIYKRLSDYSILITKGASPKWQGINYKRKGTLFITSENVREGYIDISKPKYLENKINERLPRSILRKEDILINIVGASIGRAAKYNYEYLANINQAVALVRTKNINNIFLLTYLNSEQAIKMYNDMKKGGSRENLSLKNISDLKIPKATLALQNQFSEIVKQIDKQKFESMIQLKMMEKIYNIINDRRRYV